MYTAELQIVRAWLSDPTQPGVNPIACGTRTPGDETGTLDGEFRIYAGNRVQLVSRRTDTLVRPIVLAMLNPAQMQQVMDWRGTVLLLRTIDGDRIFGGYLAVNKKRYYNLSADRGQTFVSYDATINFTRVTYDESV